MWTRYHIKSRQFMNLCCQGNRCDSYLLTDPGAGKTIMAGLYIRELVMRADARRVLIVAPGSLVEQWRDELCSRSSD